MLNNQTMEKLHTLRLTGMAESYRKQMEDAEMAGLSFEERFALLVEEGLPGRVHGLISARPEAVPRSGHRARRRQSGPGVGGHRPHGCVGS